MSYQPRVKQQMVAYDKLEITADGKIPYDGDVLTDEMISDDFQLLLPDLTHCRYCSAKLLKVKGEDIEYGRLVRDYCLWYCRNCRFWQTRIYSDLYGGCMPGPDNWAYISKSREFDTRLPNSCTDEMASFIRRNPSFLHSCNPKSLEKLVAEIFKANFAETEVIHVGKPDDGGIDVLLIDSGGQQWLIQVKRRESPKQSEGISTIRNMLGAMLLEGSLNGIVVSTANQFSLRAQQGAVKAGEIGMTVKLVDKGILNRMLDPLLPDRPWLKPVSVLDKELGHRLAEQIDSDAQLSLFSEPNLQI